MGRWLWGHFDLGLNLGSAAYPLCDPSKFLNLFELQFAKLTGLKAKANLLKLPGRLAQEVIVTMTVNSY